MNFEQQCAFTAQIAVDLRCGGVGRGCAGRGGHPDFATVMAELKAKLDANIPPDKVVVFVTRLYKVCLDCEPETAGLNGWVE